MSGLVSEQMLVDAIKGAEGVAKVTAGVATELVNEAINLFIIESVLGILKFAAVFIVFFIVKKYIDTMLELYKEKEGMFKALKTSALIASIIFFTSSSFPHIVNIAKAIVAPKIFLIEKGAEIMEKVRK